MDIKFHEIVPQKTREQIIDIIKISKEAGFEVFFKSNKAPWGIIADGNKFIIFYNERRKMSVHKPFKCNYDVTYEYIESFSKTNAENIKEYLQYNSKEYQEFSTLAEYLETVKKELRPIKIF